MPSPSQSVLRNLISRNHLTVWILVAVALTSQSATAKGDEPKDEGHGWTIYLQRFTQSNHYRAAEDYRKGLMKNSGWRDVYVVHDLDESTIYRGQHRRHRSALKRLKKVKAFTVRGGLRPFASAHLEPIPEPDPRAPKEWDLRNAEGFYTLQIGYYHGKGRKKAAKKAVEVLRNEGELAYYYHGRYNSLISIGAFPQSALKVSNADKTTEITVYRTPKNKSPREAVVFKPTAVRYRIVYSRVQALKAKYPYHGENGLRQYVRDDQGQRHEIQSFFVRIPQQKTEDLGF